MIELLKTLLNKNQVNQVIVLFKFKKKISQYKKLLIITYSFIVINLLLDYSFIRIDHFYEFKRTIKFYNNNRYSIKGEKNEDVRKTILANYHQIFKELSQLLTKGQDVNLNSLKDANDFVFLTMILVFSVSVGNILSMSPIFYFNQSKRERFLKLFATFPRDKIERMVEQYEESINELLELFYFSKAEKNQDLPYVSHDIKFKKRSIGQTSSIPRVKLWLVLIQLISFCLFFLYPALKLFYGYQAYDQHFYGSKELFYIGQSNFLWSSTQGLLFANTNAVLQNSGDDIKTILKSFMNDLLVMNQESLNNYYKLEDQFTKPRWLQTEFDQFIVQSIEKDICKGVFENLEFLTNKQLEYVQKKTINECNTSNNGVFTNGVLFVLKKYFGIAQEIWQDCFDSNQNINDFVKTLRSLDSKYDINTIQDSYFVFQVLLSAITDVNLNIQNEVYSEMNRIEYLLIIYALIIIVLIFGFGWRYFIIKLNKSLTQTTQILCLMTFDQIVENPYIMSYISKNSSLQV